MRMRYPIGFALVAASVAFARPHGGSSSIPPAATAALKKIDAACGARDYRALRALMEATILDEAGSDPVSSDHVIRQWKADPSALSNIAKAIHAGCEPVGAPSTAVVCPPKPSLPSDPEAPAFLIAVRPSAGGAWRIYQALYAD
jgi:hypothetical protein